MTAARQRWFAAVESNTTGSGRKFCAAARARGLRPVVLAKDPARYPYIAEDGLDALVVDTSDLDAVRDACRGLLEGDGLAGVTSSSEYFVGTAAAVAHGLGLPAPDAAAIARCRDKSAQRAALAAAGVPVPAFRAVRDADGAVRAAAEIGCPVVLKPVSGSGSVGVRLCHDATDVHAWATGLLGDWTNERGVPGGGTILVEEYVDGPEFSVETFDAEVVGVVGKHVGRPPYFVETGHDVPAPVPEPQLSALGAGARAAITALGLTWGAAHTELRLGPRGPVVIEVNPRLAGGMIPELVQLALGVDLVDAVVARACGLPCAHTPAAVAHAAIRFLLTPGAGTVTAVDGVREARGLPGVREVRIGVRPGDAVTVQHSFKDRLGFVIATGSDAATAARRAAAAAECIRCELR
ncbi:ATP-grasp domain-containing protein [Streptomyces sp. NPDC007100]|uniref:ATP-grasp domain-containing protein n=1 Tax=Streptomyces sp. NPDC007100 TaxID=3155602 RepID=UPI00340E9749